MEEREWLFEEDSEEIEENGRINGRIGQRRVLWRRWLDVDRTLMGGQLDDGYGIYGRQRQRQRDNTLLRIVDDSCVEIERETFGRETLII